MRPLNLSTRRGVTCWNRPKRLSSATLAHARTNTGESRAPLAEDGDYALSNGDPGKVLLKRPAGYTFGGGPGAVRDIVKQRAAAEILSGGLLELSHRERGQIHELLVSTQQLIRELLAVPQDYDILFCQGGAHAQFAAIPLNFGENPKVLSCITGAWSLKATNEQKKFASVTELHEPSASHQAEILNPFVQALQSDQFDYGYICSNETMQGVQLRDDSLFARATLPVVVDSTSDLFSRKMDISKYGVVFASGGKNFGPAGCTLVIARKDISARSGSSKLPSILSWKEFASSTPVQNIYNTPPMLAIGLARLVLDDLQKRGGVEWAETRCRALSSAIYDEIDASDGFFVNKVSKDLRSQVSVVFGIPRDPSLEAKFVEQAESYGLQQLVNHPSVGGMRASLYNAVPVKAVEHLIEFMRDFRRRHA